MPEHMGFEGQGKLAPSAPWPTVATLCAAGLVGVLLRVLILTSPLGDADSDEAVIGLMARSLLRGDGSWFYWGQPYGGALEPGTVAGLFAVVGPGPLAMKLVPIGFSAAATVLVWRIGLRSLGARPAVVAAAIFWAAPTAFVWMSTKERGFYGSTMVLGLVVVLMALRLSERASKVDALMLGVAAGLGWYSSPQVAYLVVPSLVWLGIEGVRNRRVDLLRAGGLAGLGALAGAAPWLVANVQSDWASLSVPQVPVETSYFGRLERVVTTGLPILLGLKVPYGAHWLFPGAIVLYGLLIAGFAYLVARRRGPVQLFVVVAASYPFLVALPPNSYYIVEPRYLYLLWPAVALLLASLAVGRRPVVIGVAIGAVLTLSVCGTASLVRWSDRHPTNYDLAAGDIAPLLRSLRSERVQSAFADYWVAYRINFESDEKVTAASLGFVRHAPYQDKVRASSRPAYVLFAGSGPDERLGPALDGLAVGYRRLSASQYAVYLPDTAVMPEDVPAVW